MLRNSITSKLLFLIVIAFVITTASVLIVADRQLTGIIDDSQHALHEEKLYAIWETLDRNNERLEKTGMVEAYIGDFKEASLKVLRAVYYKQFDLSSYPFIVDGEGKIVMHPVLPIGDISLKQSDIVRNMLSSNEGDFDYTYLGQKKWLHFKHFTAWNWVVGYTITWEVKYADSLKFRNLLVLIMGGITLLVLLVLSLIITRFTRPIRNLTIASKAMARGDLEQQIDSGGTDELGELAKSFNHMRDSIRQKIVELENSEERLSVTLRSIGDGVITTDLSGNVVMLNKVAENITGWSLEDAAKRPLEEVFNIIHEQTGKKCENPFARVINSGKIAELDNHTILLARDGRKLNIADSGAPIFNKESKIIGVVLVFRDATEQLKTEKELLKVKKLESIGVLAGGIAHDFNNILTAILGNISLALFENGIKERTRKILTEAEKASLRAKDLTQQLLTFSKGGEPVKETSSLDSVIRDSANFVMYGQNSLCSYDIPEDLWMVDIDKGQMSQVIQNIVLNASHAMPEGGTINIACKNISSADEVLSLPLPKEEKFVKISIQDSGIGIPDNVVDNIFDPYFSTKQEGSGLGLAIAQSILVKHNGHILVESSPGVGSTFIIYIPSSREAAIQKQETLPRNIESIHAKILVMDDEELVRTVSEEMLSQLGHDVVVVDRGERAIKVYQESMTSDKPFDLVIMDLTIPGGMGGKEAVLEILSIDSDARVVVSSGYSNDPILANYKDHGFCSVITKPYQLKELAKTISQVMDL
jgi:two-component system cell cycle sensor histidine kinase/response regulator CckA